MALLRSEVASVFIAAFGDGRIAEPQDVLAWLYENVATDDGLRVWLVRDKTPKVLGFIIVCLPCNPFTKDPHVAMLYAPEDDVKFAAVSHAVSECKALGLNAATAINRSHLPDDAYIRAFSHWFDFELQGSFFKVHFKE